jgi:hypothetical protein
MVGFPNAMLGLMVIRLRSSWFVISKFSCSNDTRFYLPYHRGQLSHDLIILKPDNPQPQRGQHLLPPFIFLFLQIVDIPINLHNQPSLMTVKIDDEAFNNLLPPKADSQLLRPHFLPKDFLGRRHLAAEFFCALEFCFGDFLIRDDIFDRHGGILR